MVVGVCRLQLHLLEEPDTLKGKRQVVRRIVDRVRSHFKVSIAEVGQLADYHFTTLGLALVSSEKTTLERLLAHVQHEIEGWAAVETILCETEYIFYSSSHGPGAEDGLESR